MGVTGWVRNQMDGSVEVWVQGSPKQLVDMCSWLREGMPAALVDEFELTELPPVCALRRLRSVTHAVTPAPRPPAPTQLDVRPYPADMRLAPARGVRVPRSRRAHRLVIVVVSRI
jgi:acylphosphatase